MPKFFIPWEEIDRTENRLPHWQQSGMTCFVTWRLADSMPKEVVQRWKREEEEWLRLNPKPWTQKQEAAFQTSSWQKYESWLDAGHGCCALRNSALAKQMGEALLFHDGERYLQHAWVVMPNHVHALFTIAEAWTLDRIVHTWKSFTAHHSDLCWQKSYHDRIIRDSTHFRRCLDYIRENPISARLPEGTYRGYERVGDTTGAAAARR